MMASRRSTTAPFGVVVLATGRPSSGREAILSHLRSVRAALASGAAEVVLVVGESQAEPLRSRLRGLPVRIVADSGQKRGVAIAQGVAALSSQVEAAVLLLGNRTAVTADHLRTLVGRLGSKRIVASTYEGVNGVPAAFARSEFPRLLSLRGDEGARSLLREDPEAVETVAFANANVRLHPLFSVHPKKWIAKPEMVSRFARESEAARAPPVRA